MPDRAVAGRRVACSASRTGAAHRRLAQLVVSVVNLTRAAVLSAAPECAAALLAELAESEGLVFRWRMTSDELEPLARSSRWDCG